jgi:hypothetical protein
MKVIGFISLCCMLFTMDYIGACDYSGKPNQPSWLNEDNDDKTLAELNKVRSERDMYRTFTQVLAPALVVKTAYHTILNQDQQKSPTCIKVAVGLSAATTLYLVGRSYLFTDDKKKE